VNSQRSAGSLGHFWFPILLACLGLFAGPSLCAQTAPLVQRLSPDTIFYVEWRGTASLSAAEQKNHLLQLMHDPDMAAALAALGSQLQRNNPQVANPIAAMLLPDLTSFLDNSAVFGFVVNPDVRRDASDKHVSPFAAFLVYDATGKTDLLKKWDALSRVGSKMAVEVTNYDFGGTSVEVRTTSTGASYSAQAGKYFVASDQKKVIEDLITRFSASEPLASSVTQLSEYSQIRRYVGENQALEFFGRIPDLSQFSNVSTPSGKSAQQFVKNLHLEKVRVLGGGVSLDGEAARIGGAILGDASPASPFDLAGESAATFQTLPAIQTAPAFSISRINFPATYQFFMGAIAGNLTPQQAGNIQMMEGAAQSFLGMPIIDALRLFTGEIGSMTTYSDDGKVEQLFAVSIQKPESVLRVVRALIGTMIVSEDSSGATTYLDIAYPYIDPETHQRRRRFYYLAVTPQMLLAAPRKGMLRQAMQRVDAGSADPPPAGVFANPDYVQLRSRLPGKLSGLGAADIAAIPWDKVLANFATQAAQSKNQSKQQPDLNSPAAGWLKPGVISRYLHIAVSGWWKDSNGVYFDSYIQ
jgi:hypothetical protein